MDESTRLESEQVAMPRGFESRRLLQEGLPCGVVHRLESGWAFAEALRVQLPHLPPGVVDYRKVS